MSKKPDKKSDLSKKWMSTRKNNPRTIAPEYHLIFTEGTKTEPHYFQEMRDHMAQKSKNFSKHISIKVQGEGANTLSLLHEAENYVQQYQYLYPYKHVWIVFDRDSFAVDNFDNTVNRCRELSNENITYHAIWSNQCFELWYILHFDYLQSDLDRSILLQILNDKFLRIGYSSYNKNIDGVFEKLYPYLNDAIRHAQNLDKTVKPGEPPSRRAPVTKVYEILQVLEPYL